MSYTSVDIAALARSSDPFDAKATQVADLLGRYSSLMDPVVREGNEATKPLAGYAGSVEAHKEGLTALQEFCAGMAERIRIAAANYQVTGEVVADEAKQLVAQVDAAAPTATGRD